MPEPPPFRGWPPAALAWFRGIEAHNTREWFLANRSTYEAAVREPFLALLAELADEFGEGKLFRPHRDTRFSTDKRPYKTAAAAIVHHPAGGGGYYVQLGLTGLYLGGGLYAPARDQLARARAAVADGRAGAQLQAITAKLARSRLRLMEDGALRTAPRGVPADHPRIGFLRLAHYAAARAEPVRAWLHTRGAKQRIVSTWRTLEPLLEWLGAHVGPSELPGR
jgi:uncharacterized protein (TIGR02453 family)